MKKTGRIILLIVLILTCFIGLPKFIEYENYNLGVTNYTIENSWISKPIRIVQISDLHNADFGNKLYEYTAEAEPDIIVVTGDLIDANHKNIELGIEQVKDLPNIAPTYYITGNHEVDIPEYPEIIKALTGYGIIDLNDSGSYLEDWNVELIGVGDPNFGWANDWPEMISSYYRENSCNILLSHRPEFIDFYASMGMDIALTGHAHGGQIRLPGTEGLFAPNQGILPKLTNGLHMRGQLTQVINRGLGNSRFPIRINNLPEIVVLDVIPS